MKYVKGEWREKRTVNYQSQIGGNLKNTDDTPQQQNGILTVVFSSACLQTFYHMIVLLVSVKMTSQDYNVVKE